MAKVIAPITALVQVIGKPRESSYEAGSFYYPTLFIDLSQPEGSEAAKIWKNLSGDEVSQIQKGDRVQLVPAGKDKSGKDKHNIMLLEEQNHVATTERSQSEAAPVAERWSADQKRAIAAYVEGQADLLGFCLRVSQEKFGTLVQTEESIKTLATTLYIAARRRFPM